MPWGYLSSKNDTIQYKRVIYTIYTTQYLYKVLNRNDSSLCVVQFKWAINSQKMFCELRNNQTIPELRGIEGLILSSTKVMWSDYYKGGCTL